MSLRSLGSEDGRLAPGSARTYLTMYVSLAQCTSLSKLQAPTYLLAPSQQARDIEDESGARSLWSGTVD